MAKEEINKTKIRLEMDKTIQPKQFEPIKIIIDIEESFYWKDEKDRVKKMNKYRNMILEDFVESYNIAVTTIGEDDRCIGRIITKGDIPVDGKKTIDVDNKDSDDDEWNL